MSRSFRLLLSTVSKLRVTLRALRDFATSFCQKNGSTAKKIRYLYSRDVTHITNVYQNSRTKHAQNVKKHSLFTMRNVVIVSRALLSPTVANLLQHLKIGNTKYQKKDCNIGLSDGHSVCSSQTSGDYTDP